MFFNAEDDEQDFMSTGGSKLANLFGLDKASGQGGNPSLTYTAPKQPKKKAETQPEGSAAPAVIVASIVHAYKYVDGKYASQGKLGAALLLTQATKDYRILLYVNKQQQVTSAKITPAFSFSIQENNYASFYDDARQMWSIMFDTSDAADKFAKEMGLARAGSGALTDLVQQDLSLGEGGALENGDSAEVKYTGWLLTNGTFGKVFDQSQGDAFFRFRVGKGKVIKGWDQGMLGMKKGGKRLLVIPPSLAYGSQGISERIPPNSSLIFEVQVVRVKLQKGEADNDSPDQTSLPTMQQIGDQDDFDSPGVKDRSRSISDNLAQSTDSGKAKLISRMARMGQPMLPFQGAVAAQPDDSDEELHQHMQQAAMKPALPTKPRSSSGVGLAAPIGQVIISQTQPTGTSPSFNMSTNHPVVLTSTTDLQQQQQPAFLQNLPGAQQMAVYQNPHNYMQQQAALLQQQQQQQQQLFQQQQQQMIHQQQQQLLGHSMSAPVGSLPGQINAFGVPVSANQPSNHASSSADALAPVLLTETRQQNTEVRIGMSKMADKVDKILEKVDLLSAAGGLASMHGSGMISSGMISSGMITPYGAASFQAPSMEANVLMQNIARVVQDNERLKREVYEQSNKVQEQNDKIASLLEKNQKYVEQSQNLLEQRSEGYKVTASQSQARVLSLEQEKVYLATELSSSAAQITTLQLELGEYRKREGELKQQLQSTNTLSSSSREELDRLRLQREEDEQKIESLNVSVRDEKLTRKGVESKLSGYQEELSELRAAKESLERSLSERKRKALEERKKLEQDLEETKLNYESTVEDLMEKIRRQKSSVDTDTQSKMSKIEAEISKEWQAKLDRMLATTSEKYSRQLTELTEEREELLRQVGELEKKLANVRSSGSSTELQMAQLQDDLISMKSWKEKYDNLRTQASTMKERYEKRIEELEEKNEKEEEKRNEASDKAKEQNHELQQKVQQLQQRLQQSQQEVQQQRTQLSTTKADLQQSASSAPAVLSDEVTIGVKKIMNSVYQTMRGEFNAGDNYQGSQVLATILDVIKQTTLKLVGQPAPKPAPVEDEDDDDDEDDDEDDEEDEEEEVHLPSKKEIITNKELLTSAAKKLEAFEPAVDYAPKVNQTEKQTPEPVEANNSPPNENQTDRQTPEPVETNNSAPKEIKADKDKQIPEPVETSNSPPSFSNSDADVVTVYEFLPSLDGGAKDEIVATEVASIAEKLEASHHDDGDRLANNVEGHDQVQTVASKINGSVRESEKEAIDGSSQPQTESTQVPKVSLETNNIPQLPPLSNDAIVVDDKLTNGDETPVQIFQSASDIKTDEPSQKVQAGQTLSSDAPSSISDSREPPPLFDDDDDDDDLPLFGTDSTVSDTLGSTIKPAKPETDAKPVIKSASAVKEKTTPGKKQDLVNDEDLKPQPPPPLFGDDSDEDDFDWLS